MRSNRVILVASVILVLLAVVGGALSAAPNPGWPDVLRWIPLDPGPVAGLSLFGLVLLYMLGWRGGRIRRRPPTRAQPVGQPTDELANVLTMLGAQRRIAAMHPTTEVPNLAHVLFHVAEKLGDAGRWPEALGAIDEGVALARSVAATDPTSHTRLLSHGLRIRAYVLLGLDRHEELRQVVAEARELEARS